jgi:hypothetical protein
MRLRLVIVIKVLKDCRKRYGPDRFTCQNNRSFQAMHQFTVAHLASLRKLRNMRERGMSVATQRHHSNGDARETDSSGRKNVDDRLRFAERDDSTLK